VKRRDNFNIIGFAYNTIIGILITAFALYIIIAFSTKTMLKKQYTASAMVITEDTLPGFTTEDVFIKTLSFDELLLQPETDIDIDESEKELNDIDIEKLKDFQYLKSNFYIVDSRTVLLENDIDAEKFLKMDLTIDNEKDKPKILIFHTHSTEMYADSDSSKGIEDGIWSVGEKLKDVLESQYDINVIHDNQSYDMIDGKTSILGAYERMEPAITKILQENPSIEVVIDLHRDGVRDDVHLVEEINGKKCAKIMFFNGLCRLNENGNAKNISSLPNAYLKDNLAFSFNMQYEANKLYPDLTRKIYLNAYRYSLNMMPKSLLIEVGAQTNTKEEAYNSMELLAEVLANVIIEE